MYVIIRNTIIISIQNNTLTIVTLGYLTLAVIIITNATINPVTPKLLYPIWLENILRAIIIIFANT